MLKSCLGLCLGWHEYRHAHAKAKARAVAIEQLQLCALKRATILGTLCGIEFDGKSNTSLSNLWRCRALVNPVM